MHEVYKLRVPEEIGQVKERYQGKSEEIVVHIQDAHTSFEAQKNLCAIIEYLVNQNDLEVVSMEGAEGSADLDMLRSLPNLPVKRAVLDKKLQNGSLTGSEVAHILSEKPFHLFGSEDMNLYFMNYDAFTNTINKREEILTQIQIVEEILNDLKASLYSEDVKAFDSSVEEYRSNAISFFDYCGKLLKFAAKCGIDISQYVSFTMLLEAKSWEDQIEFEKVEAETQQVIGLVEREFSYKDDSLSKKKYEIFSKLLNSYKNSENKKASSNAEFYTVVKNLAQEIQLDADAENFVNFFNFATYLSLFARLDKAGLLGECKLLQREIEENLAADSNELELVHLSRNIRMLQDIAELKVLPEDVNYYRENKDKFSAEVFKRFIENNGMQVNTNALSLLDEILPSVEEFYEFAEKRSEVMAENVLISQKINNAKIMPFVAGGYHTDGITKHLKEKGISYVVVTPKIDSTAETVPYLDRMLNQPTNFQLMINSAYNTLVRYLLKETEDIAKKAGEKSKIREAAIEISSDMLNRKKIELILKNEGADSQRIELALEQAPEVLFTALQKHLAAQGLSTMNVAYYGGANLDDDDVEYVQVTTYSDVNTGNRFQDVVLMRANGKFERVAVDKIAGVLDSVRADVVIPSEKVIGERLQQMVNKAVPNANPEMTWQEIFQIIFPEAVSGSAFSLTTSTIPADAKKAMKDIVEENKGDTINLTSVAQASKPGVVFPGVDSAAEVEILAQVDIPSENILSLLKAQDFINALNAAIAETLESNAIAAAVLASIKNQLSFADMSRANFANYDAFVSAVSDAVENVSLLVNSLSNVASLSESQIDEVFGGYDKFEEAKEAVIPILQAVSEKVVSASFISAKANILHNNIIAAGQVAGVSREVSNAITDIANLLYVSEDKEHTKEEITRVADGLNMAVLAAANVNLAKKVASDTTVDAGVSDVVINDVAQKGASVVKAAIQKSVIAAQVQSAAASAVVSPVAEMENFVGGVTDYSTEFGDVSVAFTIEGTDISEAQAEVVRSVIASKISAPKVSSVLSAAKRLRANAALQSAALPETSGDVKTAIDKFAANFNMNFAADVSKDEADAQFDAQFAKIEKAMTFIDAIAAGYGDEYSLMFLPPKALADAQVTTVKDGFGNDFNVADVVVYPDYETNTAYVNIAVVNALFEAEEKGAEGVKMATAIIEHDLYELQNPPKTDEAGNVIEDMEVKETAAHKAVEVPKNTIATVSSIIDKFDAKSMAVDTEAALKQTEVIAEQLAMITVSLGDRGTATSKVLKDKIADEAKSVVLIQLDQDLLTMDRLNNEEAFALELKRTVTNYPNVEQIYLVVDDVDALDNDVKQKLEVSYADPIGAMIVSASDTTLAEDKNNAQKVKVVIGRSEMLQSAITSSAGTVFGVDITTPEMTVDAGVLLDEVLPFSFATSVALELTKRESNINKVGMLVREDVGNNIYRFSADSLMKLDVANLLQSLKSVLKGMNDQLRQVRAEAKSLWTAA